ncbi:MAG: DUF362 domain-containing protein [Chloroflexi bacterium]|nr:DUF362 domain-containing protein [Chloroflexota bacterium]
MSKVALVKGGNRYANISAALELIQDTVHLDGVRHVLIKPNFTWVNAPLAATHVEAVTAVVDFLRQRQAGACLSIAEGSGTGSAATWKGVANYGYGPLLKRYGLDFVDLNTDEGVPTQIYDDALRPMTVRLARTVVEADYVVSVGPPKTHDFVIMTASLKNVVMGSLVRRESRFLRLLVAMAHRFRIKAAPGTVKTAHSLLGRGNDKMKMHQGYPVMNLNLCRLAKVVHPHLSVIDGFVAMEGEGPVTGTPVPWGLAVASTDFVAADSLTAHLMGFQSEDIGYLHYCHRLGLGLGEVGSMEVVGERVAECRRPFRPHPSYRAQLEWPMAHGEVYLA